MVNKVDFSYCIYYQKEPEEFVKCQMCKKSNHERCVLHIKGSGLPYICNICIKKCPSIIRTKLYAQNIPKTEIDEFIENFLHENNVPNHENITIRLVSNLNTSFKPKNLIFKYRKDNNEKEIRCNNCVIFAFLKISDGSEICFFGIYFQLYGSYFCPVPNQNSVYLSYIDSVKLGYMKERTQVYHSILFGLFEYLKIKNFKKIFIWSCPPKKNVDYIFYQKPQEMKIPSKCRLQTWYLNLFKTALERKIIHSFTGVKEYAEKHKWSDLTNIPYFEADLWILRIEEAIKEAEKLSRNNPPPDFSIEAKIKSLMDVQICGFDNQYFVVYLHDSWINGLVKPEFLMVNKGAWLNDRSSLVDMLWDEKLEYSTERLAKFSTFVILYKIFGEDKICRQCREYSELGINVSIKKKFFFENGISNYLT